MTEAERQSREYAAVRVRLMGVTKPINIAENLKQQRLREERETERIKAAKAQRARERAERLAAYREEAARKAEVGKLAARKAEVGKLAAMIASFNTAGQTSTCSYSYTAHVVVAADFDVQRPSMESIALAVLERHPGIGLADLRAHSKFTRMILARRDVIAAIHRIRPDLSLPQIGRFMNKDHTTILHAIRRYEEDRHGKKK